MKRIRTLYRLKSPKIQQKLRFAVVSDLHSGRYEDVLEDFESCDAVLMPGDLVDRHTRNNERAYRFMRDVPERFTVFYSIGNHERKFRQREDWLKAVKRSSIVLLDNESCLFKGVRIGGLSSAPHGDLSFTGFLEEFEQSPEYKLLLCHHPEMYRDAVRGRNVDCTLCGHAHGGQIQIRGQGIYAPGQGFFPRLTHGSYDGGKMILSRGMTNNARPRVPRINNPCELILLELEPETTEERTDDK